MKKLVMAAALLLALALLLPAAVAEESEQVGLPVYVWAGDFGFDLETLLAQVPTAEEMRENEGRGWSGNANWHRYYFNDQTDFGEHTEYEVYYNEDGSVHELNMYCALYDIYGASGMPYNIDRVYVYIDETERRQAGEMRVDLYLQSETRTAQTMSLVYRFDRLISCTYYTDVGSIDFNAYGEVDWDKSGITRDKFEQIRETYELPVFIGDMNDLSLFGAMAPDVKIYEAFQDVGIDIPALIEAVPQPAEGESVTACTDGQGNELTAYWASDAYMTSLHMMFAEPVAGVWTEMSVNIQYQIASLIAPSCSALYLANGELDSYEYTAADGVRVEFLPNGTLLNAATDDEARLAAYTPLEVIEASGQFGGQNILGVEARRTVYGNMQATETAALFLGMMAERSSGAQEQDGMITVPDDGYFWVFLEIHSAETGSYDEVDGWKTNDDLWQIDPSALTWQEEDEAVLAVSWNDEEGNSYILGWLYPDELSSPGAAYLDVVFAQPDASGYRNMTIWNGRDGKHQVGLYGEQLYEIYDMDGALLQYTYTASDGVIVRYDAAGELLLIIPEDADPSNYPPLEIAGNVR